MKMVYAKIIMTGVLIGLFSVSCLAGSFYAGEKGNEGQTTYSPDPKHQSSPKSSYSGPSKRGSVVSTEQTVMDTIVRAPAKKANQWVMKQFNCDQKTARSMIERSVRYYQGQARFWNINAASANAAKTLTPAVVFACDVLLTGGGVYQAASAVAKNIGKKQAALFATQGMNAICKTFYYFAKYGHHKHGNPKMGTAEDVFKYVSDTLNTFNAVFGMDLSTTPDKINSIIGLVTDGHITAARNALAKGVIRAITFETTGNVQGTSHSDMPTPYNISKLAMPGTVQIRGENNQYLGQVMIKKNIKYRVLAGQKPKQRPSGQATLKPGETITVLNIAGGCGANDFAQCIMDKHGRLVAFYKDSCGSKGIKGEAVSSGSSKASFKKYYCECQFSTP